MTISFSINYQTQWGQSVVVQYAADADVHETAAPTMLRLECHGSADWSAQLTISDIHRYLSYSYAVLNEQGEVLRREDVAHKIDCTPGNLVVRDRWQDNPHSLFASKVFSEVLFAHRPMTRNSKMTGNINVVVYVPRLERHQSVAIMGNVAALGQWDKTKMLRMSNISDSDDTYNPLWTASFHANIGTVVEYKYVIIDTKSGEVIDIEWGENRKVWDVQRGKHYLIDDEPFRYTQANWKGAGVAVPVFSLRSENGFGIGEFQDLKLLADWAVATGQKMIQTLPINDTTLLHTNRDSYPYNAVSVFALHPIYINIEKMGTLTPAQKKKYLATKAEFNKKAIADYQCVYDEKMKYFKALYKAEKAAVFASEAYKAFVEKNKEWLLPYAQFMSKRDKLPKDFYCYLQFHADKQLADAVEYAHSVGVAIKGDIPIGISPDSVDATTAPQLFNLDASAGAPPDDFDARGQNWGFPTYNWDVMAEDNYQWWRKRFTKMADYFDAYRIDHILGFFRIWQMRKTDVWGLCGHFSPAMPYTLQDLWNMGVKLDEDRMTKPYIRSNFLGDVFGYDTDYAKEHFLNTRDGYVYWFKDEFDTQVKVQAYFDNPDNRQAMEGKCNPDNVKNGLLYLHCEVLFVRDQRDPELLHPRIALYQSHSYAELYEDQRQLLANIHNDYFYRRHTDFWRESAMRKLPTLIAATDMLCCGEDLGMVPSCVPQVMHQLQILSLEIQRMPKDPTKQFAHPADAPYLSVCTTGTHDMNPLRAWWEEDRAVTQRFYNEQMGWQGEAPHEMTPEIAEFIINQHMYSPAMWVILPLQDWLAIDGEVRLPDAHAERINLPSDPHHFWNYRMHLCLEDLLHKDAFNAHVRHLTQVR